MSTSPSTNSPTTAGISIQDLDTQISVLLPTWIKSLVDGLNAPEPPQTYTLTVTVNKEQLAKILEVLQ